MVNNSEINNKKWNVKKIKNHKIKHFVEIKNEKKTDLEYNDIITKKNLNKLVLLKNLF